MKGAQHLVDMRRVGRRPACVWLHDDDFTVTRDAVREWADQPNAFDGQLHAVVRIEASDIPEALDLRMLVGLTVHVSSERGAQRHQRIFEAVATAKAAATVAVINGAVVIRRPTQEQPLG